MYNKKILLIMVISSFFPALVLAGGGGASIDPDTNPGSVYMGKTATLKGHLRNELFPINTATQVKELYLICALKNPNNTIVWNITNGITRSSSDVVVSHFCDKQWTFNIVGNWKLGIALGYINQTWNGTAWNIESGIYASTTVNLEVLPIPSPPVTTSETLQQLFNLFLKWLSWM